jgi:hypothetical protein
MSTAGDMRTAAGLMRQEADATGTHWERFVANWLEREATIAAQSPGVEDPAAVEVATTYLDGAR